MDEDNLRYEGYRVAGASGVGVLGACLYFFSFPVFLKPLIEEFAWSREAVSSAFGAMALAGAVAAPILGLLIDRFGAKYVAAASLLVSGSAFASLSMLTANLWHLYAVFAAIGLTFAGSSPVGYTRAVSSWFDRRRGVALAMVIAAGAVGGIVHPPIAQALIGSAGWRTAYLLLGGAVLVIGVPTVFRFVRPRESDAGRAQALVEGSSVADALRSRIFWTLVIVVFGGTLAMSGVIVHLSALLTDRGARPELAALVLSAMGAASLAGRLSTGWFLDRFAAQRVSFVLLAIAALGCFLLASTSTFGMALIAAVLIGFGHGGETDVTPYMLSRYFGLRSLSTLYGLNWTAWGIAGAVAPTLMGRAFDTTGSYNSVLIQLSMATIAVAALMLTLPAYARASREVVAAN